MKVGIITMHCPLNYGAVLQTYALQTYIESLGHSVEVIDYRPNYIVYDQSLLYIPDGPFKRSFVYRIGYLVFKVPHKLMRRNIFKRFTQKYLNLTHNKYSTFTELCAVPPLADRYICGSDQIWSLSNGAYKDPSYFLGFIENGDICASYAASGMIPQPLPDEMKNSVVPLINRLGNVSVREASSVKVLQPYVDKKIVHLLDPVFLLSVSEWENLMVKRQYSDKKYILVYTIGNTEQVYENASKLSKATGWPIYCISGSQRRDKRINRYICPTPTEFLSLFYNAAHIVTNSFHGTAFSIIFKKSFNVCSTDIANERLISLLETADLLNVLIDHNYSSNSQIFANVCYGEKLSKMIEMSKNYIQRIIKS